MRQHNGKKSKSYKDHCSQIAWTAGILLEDDGDAVYRDGQKIAEGEERWFRVYLMLQKEVDQHPEWNWCALMGIGGSTTVGKIRD